MAQVQFSTFLILRRTDRLDLTCCVVRLERFAVCRPETNGALSVLKVDVIAAFHVIEVLDGAALPVQRVERGYLRPELRQPFRQVLGRRHSLTRRVVAHCLGLH